MGLACCAFGHTACAGDGQPALGALAASAAAVVSPVVEPPAGARSTPLLLPRAVDEILHWLPENTETVAVAQSFTVGSVLDWYEGKGGPPGQAARCFLAALCMEDLVRLGCGPREVFEAGRSSPLLRMIGGLHVVLGVYGGRDYDPADCRRREACGILIFDSSLPGKSKEFIEALHGLARTVHSLLRHEVFVYAVDAGVPAGPRLKSEELLVVVPRPNVLLWSSSEAYLDEMLRRVGCAPLGRALSDELPEWKYVDPRNGAFLVRHIPQRSPRPALTGLVMSGQSDRPDALQICYLLAAGGDVKIPSRPQAAPQALVHNKAAVLATIDLKPMTGGPAERGGKGFWQSATLGLVLPQCAGLPDTGPVAF